MASTLQHETRQTPRRDAEVEFGGFAPERTLQQSSTLVIVTFNLRYCVGSHLISGSLLRRIGFRRPRRRPHLILKNIERAARALYEGTLMPRADVVAIQEADRGTQRAGGKHVAFELARSLGMNYARVHVPTPHEAAPKRKKWWLDFEEQITVGETGDTGVAILSRLPLSGVERIELPWKECEWRPRLALASCVPLGQTHLHLFNSHIDTHASIEGQLEQHRAVLARAEHLTHGEPSILLGDFNTMTIEACQAVRSMLGAHDYTTPLSDDTWTWRSGPLHHHFDWIFTRGLSVRRWGVAQTHGISDHWPVWVEVETARTET